MPHGRADVAKARRKIETAGKHGHVLTIGQVAQALGVSHQLVRRWCDEGILRHHVLPGGSHRRVRWEDAVAFAARYPSFAAALSTFSVEQALPIGIKPRAGLLTTGEAARFLGVCSGTVCKWCDDGTLPSHRIPSSKGKPGERRISYRHLVAFAQLHDIDVDEVRMSYEIGEDDGRTPPPVEAAP